MSKENQEKISTYEEQENIPNRSETGNVVELVAKVLEDVTQFQPDINEDRLQKMYLQEQLGDIITTLREGGDHNTLNLIIAYRGLEQAKNQSGLKTNNFGIDNVMNELRGKVSDIEGFDLGKIEDLDQVFEEARGEVKKAIQQNVENFSEEGAAIQKNKFERYFVLKKEIQARRRQILGESKSFYQGISEKISGQLLEFLTEKGEKIDDKMKDSRVSLLKYIGKYGAGNKLARAVGLGIIAAGALGFIFKGEIAQAAQYGNEMSDDHGDKIANGWISPEELKLKDPEVYRLLEEKGFIKKAGIEYEEDDKPKREKERKRPPKLSEAIKDMLPKMDVARLLETDKYRNADTPQELKALYDEFDEKDNDLSDDLAVVLKYNEFLDIHSTENLIAEYGEEYVGKIFQEAGFVTFKSLEKLFDKDIQDSAVDSESLEFYLRGFKKASDFYESSLNLNKEYVRDGKLNKTFGGLIEMNNAFGHIADTAMIYGNNEDKYIAALMRNFIHQNVKEFNRLKGKIDIVYLGHEKFLFLDKNVLNNIVREGVGGMCESTANLAKEINEGIAMGKYSAEEKKFINSLVSKKILIKTEQGFVANPEKPYLSFSLPETYQHESQHYELVKNENLMKYWVNEWNAKSENSKMDFLNTLYGNGGYLRGITREEIKSLVKKDFSFEKIKNINSKDLRGIKVPLLEAFQMSVLQEFQAYSTDNLLRMRFDPKHEIAMEE